MEQQNLQPTLAPYIACNIEIHLHCQTGKEVMKINKKYIQLAIVSTSIFLTNITLADTEDGNDAYYQVGGKTYQIPAGMIDSTDMLIEMIDSDVDVSSYGVSVVKNARKTKEAKTIPKFQENNALGIESLAASSYTSITRTANYTTPYLNWWDESFSSNCPSNMFVSGIDSVHHNYYEDRRFKLTCSKYKSTSTGKQVTRKLDLDFTSGYVNWFDQPLSFTCPSGDFMVGMASYHDNYYEDRRFRFTCSPMQIDNVSLNATTCSNTATSYWDAPSSLTAGNGAFIGLSSYHSDYYEDRRMTATYCSALN